MANDKSPESTDQHKASSISLDASDWGQAFITSLETEYTELASRLPPSATHTDFLRVMIGAVTGVVDDSGAAPAGLVQWLEKAAQQIKPVDDDDPWTPEKHARRLLLVDKQIQQTISSAEAFELTQLTGQLRADCDGEDMVPLEGARRLHRRLLDMDEL